MKEDDLEFIEVKHDPETLKIYEEFIEWVERRTLTEAGINEAYHDIMRDRPKDAKKKMEKAK